MSQYYHQALCPVCCTAHGTSASQRIRIGTLRNGRPHMMPIGIRNHWQRMLEMYRIDKEFGVSQRTGRAGFADVELWGPDDPRAEEFKEPMKKIFLMSIQRMIQQGIITREEVEEVLK